MEEAHPYREYAEVGYVPNELAHSKKGEPYRYLAIREVLRQQVLPGMELPFQTLECEGTQYKLHGLVSNTDWAGDESSPLPMNVAANRKKPTPFSKKTSQGESSLPGTSERMARGGG